MLLPWLSLDLGLPGPDHETHYYPTETGGTGSEYEILGAGNLREFVASERSPRVEYRVEPTRR